MNEYWLLQVWQSRDLGYNIKKLWNLLVGYEKLEWQNWATSFSLEIKIEASKEGVEALSSRTLHLVPLHDPTFQATC
jgi:hypothetical protein